MSLALAVGQRIRITDPEGQQVADLVAFCRRDLDEWFSGPRTMDYAGTLRITKGHVLYSNRSRAMLVIEEDTVGRHDLLFAPCSREMFEVQYGAGDHPNCLASLTEALRLYGVPMERIPTPFNIFMNVDIDSDTGAVTVRPPLSGAGSHIVLRAEMDLIVAVSACSAEKTNAGSLGPIEVEILGEGM